MTLQVENTLASLAPGVNHFHLTAGEYHPRKGLAIYYLPIPGYSPAYPGSTLGEALSARSGLGCTMLEGVPAKVPDGAVVVGEYAALKSVRPDLVKDLPTLRQPGQYGIAISNHAVIAASSREGLASGMQTLAMLVLRHPEPTIPGLVIVDKPACQIRGLAVEISSGELGVNLLMQIASFAATFKANRLYLILEENFDPGMLVPGMDVFIQACQSQGISVGIRLPWLKKILAGEKSLLDAWTGIRAAARLFGASQAGLDDPCPEEVEAENAARVVKSMLKGEVGLAGVEVDARLILASGVDTDDLRALGVTGWTRMKDSLAAPDRGFENMPLQIDVEAPVPGFTSGNSLHFHRRLDAALSWLSDHDKRDILVSFRDLGVSHLWQNMLLPTATGLIASWGKPASAHEAAELFANLLYGDHGNAVLASWDAVAACFPADLPPEAERLVRRTAFGQWPESDEALETLAEIDWLGITKNIRAAADLLKDVAATLNRNTATLSGAKLSLHAISWLHCFIALTPELARRRRFDYDEDGRTESIAAELFNNFAVWHNYLVELQEESGLEIAEMPLIEDMGMRLRELCQVIFDDQLEEVAETEAEIADPAAGVE
ncbi:MAG: hypothetical protein LIP23_08920 [Planctomycetes bacterium]|nr:hypothetical protein [Planctomycetota bacterium]